MTPIDASGPCPCGNPDKFRPGVAVACSMALPPGSAAQLMRSRYSAYVLQREDYLLASWHPATRPIRKRCSWQRKNRRPPGWGWRFAIERTSDADHASVEFIARYRLGGGRAQRQHELSRFVREHGRWYYLDGEMKR